MAKRMVRSEVVVDTVDYHRPRRFHGTMERLPFLRKGRQQSSTMLMGHPIGYPTKAPRLGFAFRRKEQTSTIKQGTPNASSASSRGIA